MSKPWGYAVILWLFWAVVMATFDMTQVGIVLVYVGVAVLFAFGVRLFYELVRYPALRWWCFHVPTEKCHDCGRRISNAEWIANWTVCDACFERGCPCNGGRPQACPLHNHEDEGAAE